MSTKRADGVNPGVSKPAVFPQENLWVSGELDLKQADLYEIFCNSTRSWRRNKKKPKLFYFVIVCLS